MRLSVMSLIAAAMMLAGCAGSATQAPRRTANSVDTNTASLDNLDYAKMAAIERVAYERGVRIFWINPPTKD